MIALPRKVLCIDWDQRSLRLVVAKVGRGGMKLEDAHSHRIPTGVDSDDPQALGAFILQMIERHRWSHKKVIVDVPRDKTVINRLSLAPTPVNELPAVVRFQAIKELPFPADQAAIDFVELERNEDGLVTAVLLAAARTQTISRIRETCEAAGLTAVRIGLRPYANLISVTQQPQLAEQRVLFLDVGPTLTEIDVIKDGQLAFSRTAHVVVPPPRHIFSSEDSFIAAQEELEELAQDGTSQDTAVSELIVEVTRTLQAYRATEVDARIDRVVLAGGTDIEVALGQAIETRFKLPSELFNPSETLNVSSDQAAKLRSFTAPLGLAWGLSADGKLALDFLNPKREVPKSEILQRRIRVAVMAAVIVLLAVGGYGYREYQKLKREYDEIQAEVAAETGSLWQQANARLNKIEMVEAVEDWQRSAAESIWLDHLMAVSEAAVEPGKAMVLKSVKMESRGNRPSIQTDVMARDISVLLNFYEALDDYAEGDAYVAEMQRKWVEGTGHPKFIGSSSIRAELARLRAFEAAGGARYKEKRERREEVLKGERSKP